MVFQSLNHNWRALQSPDESLVKVFPVCSSSLLRLGLENILSGTRFVMQNAKFDDSSDLPDGDAGAPVLFIVDGGNHPGDAVDVVRHLRTQSATGKIVVLADQFEIGTVTAAWAAGANGFCLSNIRHDILVRSLELVMLGEVVLPFALALSAMEELAHHAHAHPAESTWNVDNSDLKGRKLSSREAEILLYLQEGAPNKVIARKLKLSEATVKVHVKAILRKVGAGNRTQAALWAAHNLTNSPAVYEAEVA